ncbi:hypothetical protein ABZ921_09965 [Streptomyces atriruber]|uniref:DUF4367 domain-containing protein n=1 Tax=Streptomyces atriruber TaxID=545121 RepID=A0ABV3BIW3_9ACTN
MDDRQQKEPERYKVEFASGTAASVQKRRSFRDRDRNDIEVDLPGWPAGKPFKVRGFLGKVGRHALNVVTALLMLPLHILADALGGYSAPDKRGPLDDRANEVDDFPVMWADKGEAARTLPWQLDPARRPLHVVTELEVDEADGLVRITTYKDTARGNRFIEWGGGEKVPGSEAVLWSMPLKEIAGAEIKRFSMAESDFTISFRDGSWVRLETSAHCAEEVVSLLTPGP